MPIALTPFFLWSFRWRTRILYCIRTRPLPSLIHSSILHPPLDDSSSELLLSWWLVLEYIHLSLNDRLLEIFCRQSWGCVCWSSSMQWCLQREQNVLSTSTLDGFVNKTTLMTRAKHNVVFWVWSSLLSRPNASHCVQFSFFSWVAHLQISPHNSLWVYLWVPRKVLAFSTHPLFKPFCDKSSYAFN